MRGRWKAATRKVRELAMVGRALASTGHPVLAQIVPARFCNLSCAYCRVPQVSLLRPGMDASGVTASS